MKVFIAAWVVLAAASGPAQRGAGTGAPAVPGADILTGRVIDASGQAVPGVFVSALFPASLGRRFSNEPKDFATTADERGEFRLTAIGSRDFYLVAIPHNAAADAVNRMGFGTTFYPSALTSNDARLIRLTPARPTRVEIVLRDARLSRVTGRVLASTGQAVREGRLEFSHLDGLYGFDARGVDIQPDGTFLIPAMQPGSYFLEYRETGSATGPPNAWKVSRAKFRIVDRDVTDVIVAPVTMVKVTGRVILSVTDRTLIAPSIVKVAAWPVDSDDNPGPQVIGNVRPDWTFEFYTWPGVGRVRVELRTSFPPPVAVKAVRLNGMNVMEQNITFEQGRDLSGLEVELSPARGPGRKGERAHFGISADRQSRQRLARLRRASFSGARNNDARRRLYFNNF